MKKLLFTSLLVLLLFVTGCHGQVKTELNILYGEAGGQKLLLDVIHPSGKSQKPRAALILVHGGAWSGGDKSEFHDFANQLAGQGYVTFCINYRLVTPNGNKWPAQLDDAQRAVRWVRAHAVQYGVAPEKIGAIGGSAGGHIVACLATVDTRDNSDPALSSYSSRVACVVDLSGPTDLTDDMAPEVKDGAWTNEQIRLLLGGQPDQFQALARDASPLFQVDAKTCPILIVQGQKDEVVPATQAQRFAQALQKAGVEVRLLILAKEGHGIENMDSLLRVWLETNAFLKKHLPL